ncbi:MULTISPECIES: sensor histidine kinase [Pseudofrankia]|uniref:sensor histidine kinase n=1 Tax=Pseudofrankia TaxID=2994363 RepID=UPI000234CA9E|nr:MULTISPECIES: HAMP domain-containing sensor histidine kinase [Pseudofrankia]
MRSRQPRTLQARLAVVVAAVLLAALGLSGATTYLAFAVYLRDRLDAALRDTPVALNHYTSDTTSQDATGDGDDDDGDNAPGPRVAPFVQFISADGTVLLTQAGRDAAGRPFTANLPSVLPTVARSDGPGGPAAFFDTRSREPSGPRLRVKVSADKDGQVVILALPSSENDRLLHRLAVVEACVTAAALLLASGAAFWVVRRRLTPLRRLADAVESLSPNDLAVRVQVDTTTREVHELATATNLLLQRMDDAFTKEQATQEGLRRFIADASHELRTPIAAVSAYAQLFDLGARDRPLDLARSMSGIQRETSRMRDLAEDLLTLAAAEESTEQEAQTADLAAVIRQAVDTAVAVDPRWPVTLTLAAGLGMVAAGPARLHRVLDNLIGNVRAHTPPGTRVQINARHEGANVIIAVADDGPGLTADEQAHMFDRFWRKDPSRSRQVGGSGLGLSIVATIVKSWNGHVTASQTPGGGLTVTFTLPAT